MAAVILIAGVPCVGKSSFCRYLKNQKGWIHLDIDLLCIGETRWPSRDLESSWNLAIQTNNPEDFVRRSEQLGNVVIDWGFPVRLTPFVKALGLCGVKLAWMDGDIRTVKDLWRKERSEWDEKDLDLQLASLAASDLPSALGAKVIRVLEPGPQFMPPKEILERLAG